MIFIPIKQLINYALNRENFMFLKRKSESIFGEFRAFLRILDLFEESMILSMNPTAYLKNKRFASSEQRRIEVEHLDTAVTMFKRTTAG